MQGCDSQRAPARAGRAARQALRHRSLHRRRLQRSVSGAAPARAGLRASARRLQTVEAYRGGTAGSQGTGAALVDGAGHTGRAWLTAARSL